MAERKLQDAQNEISAMKDKVQRMRETELLHGGMQYGSGRAEPLDKRTKRVLAKMQLLGTDTPEETTEPKRQKTTE